jgi:L-lactate dehydrogenase complex protein LldF
MTGPHIPTFSGTPPFPTAARRSLGDAQLRVNMSMATATIQAKRQRAIAEMDDWEQLRSAGAAIKDDALARLPDLLVQLEERVVNAGGVVHWARDAVEANAIVTRIVRDHGATEVVKVKGANFAVAETGTIVVLESEGNGRMCLTLPKVLVSIVGIEKVVPTWADLEVFLQLLPRSSTAERMNPYTSTWTGVTPGDGPAEFHLILLDNGRSATLADPVGRQALRCIRCSACLNVCPVYRRTGGVAYGSAYPGPIGAILTPQLRGINQHQVDKQTASLPFASSLCGACYEVCPVRIDIPEVLVHLRTKVVDRHRGHDGERVVMAAAQALFRKPRWLAAVERIAGALLGRRRWLRMRGPGWVGAWFASRDFPPPAREPFRVWWRRSRS